MVQQIVSGAWFDLEIAHTAFENIWGGHSWDTLAVEHHTKSIVSTPGTISNLRIKMTDSIGTANYPGVGDSFIFTLYKNDAATSLTCTISETETEKSDTFNSVAVAAGDTLYLHCVPTGSPGDRYITFSLTFAPTSDADSIYGYLGATWWKTQATVYDVLVGIGTPTTTENLRQQIVATNGKFKNLRVELSDNPGSGSEAYRITLRVDGVSTALTVTITGAATSGEDTAHTVTVTPGQKVCWLIEAIDTPSNNTTGRAGFTFEADNAGESLFINGYSSDMDNSATRYYALSHNVRTWDADEYKQRQLAQNCTVSKLYVRLNTAPGSGKSWTFVLRKNGADTDLTCTLSGSSTTGSDTSNTVAIRDGHYVDIKVTPFGSPTATPAFWGAIQGKELVSGFIWVEDTDTPIDRFHFTDSSGVEQTNLAVADVDDTPIDGVTTAPISSNWAYDYAQAWEDKKKLIYLGL